MEMKLYEKLGIRYCKKFVLWVMSKVIRNPENRHGTNYYLEGINLKAVKKFKKMLWLNGLIHACVVILYTLTIICNILDGNVISFSMLIQVIYFFVNLYCVMLQRYNWLRIKKVLAKVARK